LNLQFQYPQALYLLGLIPVFLVFYLLYLRWKRKTLRKMGDPEFIRSIIPRYSPIKAVFKIIFLLLAFALGCVAVANPRRPDPTTAEARKGIDIVLALDVSNSMKATDLAPDRLSRAQQFIGKLIDNLQDDRIGLVVFAGTAYAQMPLTFDQFAARMYVSAADPSAITAQGTSISDALKKADLVFGQETERFRSVILITDGETHDENALEAVQELAAKGIMINTVGIGSPEGSTLIDSSGQPKLDASGQVVVSKLNEQVLKQIAAATNGSYVHLQSADAAVKDVLAQYANIEKKALGDSSLFTYQTYYMWLVAPMLLLLLIEIFLPDRKRLAL
jgi:Ca-activated chloride channel family protein